MEFTNLFKDLTIGDLWPAKKRDIVFFATKDKVSHALRQLSEKQVLSAPVFNQEWKLVGLLDVLDIALFVIAQWSHKQDVPIDQWIEQGKNFENVLVEDVLQLSQGMHINFETFFPVSEATTIRKLMDMFYLGVHRVPVVNDKGTLLNIITQSDLLSVVVQLLPLVKESERKKTITELNVGTSSITPVPFSSTTISVVSKMNTSLRSPLLSAVAIVDKDGKLIANFSASNLKGLNGATYPYLMLNVLDFLALQPKNSFQLSIQNKKSLNPITVDENATIEQIVEKMAAYRIHRIWVVDQDKKPIKVISIGDIFKVLLPYNN